MNYFVCDDMQYLYTLMQKESACAIVAASSVLGRVFALEIEVHEGALDFFHLLDAIL